MSALIMNHRPQFVTTQIIFVNVVYLRKLTTLFIFVRNASVKPHPTHLTMSLWVDKHRPRTLEKLTYNNSLSKSLKAIVPLDSNPRLNVSRPHPLTFPTCSCTVPLAQARRLV